MKIHRLLPSPILAAGKRWRDGRRVRRRHDQALACLRRQATAITRGCLGDLSSLADWQARRPELLRQLLWMLGLDPLPQAVPVSPRITGMFERELYRVEKLVLETLPGLLVTANLYLPKGAERAVPCVIYLCGHWPHPLGAKVGFQERYLWYPAHGFACLVVDPVGFGEVPGVHHSAHDADLCHWLSLGYTPAGVEVFNAMRTLDFLETRAEVDAQRVGVTGVSGGGVMSWYFAAVDERVAAAAPSCSTYTIGSQAEHSLVGGQCDCTFYPNVHQLDFPVLGALIAPRPLLVTSGRRDELFPPDGYHEAYRRARRVYELHGAASGGRIREVDAHVGHEDPPQFLREQRSWMLQWLAERDASEAGTGKEREPAPEPPANLACLSEVPSRATNFGLPSGFLRARGGEVPATVEGWRARRREILEGLSARVLRWFPTADTRFVTRPVENHGGYAAEFSTFSELLLETEPGVPVRLLLLRPKRGDRKSPLLVAIRRSAGGARFPDLDHLLPLLATTSVLVVYPRLGELATTFDAWSDIERTAAMTGRTVAAMQIWDVLRTVRWALDGLGLEPSRVSTYGRGEAGIIGLYAALFEERIDHVVLRDPPSSHRAAAALLAVLRLVDIPEVAAVLAPRSLTFLVTPPPAFELTEKIYALTGAVEAVERTSSLAEALLSPSRARAVPGDTPRC